MHSPLIILHYFLFFTLALAAAFSFPAGFRFLGPGKASTLDIAAKAFFQKKGCTGGIGFMKFVEKGNGNVENAAGSSFIEENVAQH